MLVCALLLAGMAPASFHLSDDPRVQEARKLARSGQYLQALQILRPLRNVHADQTDVLFLIGFSSLQAALLVEEGDVKREALLDDAIDALHEILVDRPELVRVRLELARAFFHKQEDELARENFELVKAGDQPQAMIANIDRFLRAIRARRGWEAHFGLSISPDTNIGSNSANRIINIGGLPFVLDDEDPVSSGIGLAAWGGVTYQIPVSEDLFFRTGFDLSRREYKGHQFDYTFAAVKAGPRWIVSDDTVVNVQVSVSQSWTGRRRDFIDNGVSADVSRNFSPRLRSTARIAWAKRRYHRTPGNDGPLRSVSLSAAYLLSPTVQAELAVGYTHQRPDTYRLRNSSISTTLGVSFALPKGYAVGIGSQYQWIDFRGNWTPFVLDGTPRKDITRSLRLSVHNRSLTLYGFSPQLVLIKERRKSKAQLFDYQRDRLELNFVRQF